MKVYTPQISWHDCQPILSVDIQNRLHSKEDSKKNYRLATCGNDSHVIIWKLTVQDDSQKPITSIKCLTDLDKHQRTVNVVRFSPNLTDNFLASGDDDSLIFIWKFIEAENQSKTSKSDNDKLNEENKPETESDFMDSENISIENWKLYKILRGHDQDVCDLSWSPDGQHLVSGSLDNKAFVWDIHRNVKLYKVAKDHSNYIQGITWDPLNKYIASLSADRNLIICNSQNGKTLYRINKVDFEDPNPEFPPSSKLFYDISLMSFFRRLSFTPGGELLIAPTGIVELENDKFENVVYIFERKSLSRPSFVLPTNKFSVAIKCCPIIFELNKDVEQNISNIPYRIVFAVATKDSIIFYDSQQHIPFAYTSDLHYLRFTDISWSHDGRILMATSSDGFSSFVIFDEYELGTPYKGKLLEFDEIDALNTMPIVEKSTPPKKQNESKPITSTPITAYFKKIPQPNIQQNVNEMKNDKDNPAKTTTTTTTAINNNTNTNTNNGNDQNLQFVAKSQHNQPPKPGRRVQLITLFNPKEKPSSNPASNDVNGQGINTGVGDDGGSVSNIITGMKRKQSECNSNES